MLRDTSKSNEPTKASTGARSDARSQKPTSGRNAGGRPRSYTSEVAAEICERIANGETLMCICEDAHMPSRRSVTRWLTDETKTDFLEKYALARELQADNWADELVTIADDAASDWIKRGENGEVSTLNHEHIARSKIRIETRQWLIERLNPKKYGRKTELKHDASDAFLKLWQALGSGLSASQT